MKGMSENYKLKMYKDKKMQSDGHEKADEESHRYLQCNIEPKKVASIIAVQKQMVKTRLWKGNRGLHVKSGKSRICRKAKKNSNALVISMYKTSCNDISEKTQLYANDIMCDIENTRKTVG